MSAAYVKCKFLMKADVGALNRHLLIDSLEVKWWVCHYLLFYVVAVLIIEEDEKIFFGEVF